MDKETMNQVFSYVDALAQKLGVAANHVMEIYMKQQFVEAVSGAILLTLLYIITYLSITKVIPALIKKYGNNFWNEPVSVFYGIGGAVLAMVLIMSTTIGLPSVVGKCINPEYYAIQSIFEAFSGNK